MASYCCFWKPRRPTKLPRLGISNPGHGQLISFQHMLGLLGRPDVGVVVIEGLGGSGKTWAAKAAYRTARTSNLFDEYIWVSLSLDCTTKQCIDKIAASLPGSNRDNLSVQSAKTIIKEYLTSRKFLLVFDNAYFTEENILEHMGVPHPQQQSLGSKIFVTTITRRTLCVMKPDIVLTPQPLTYEESYNLLREKIGKDISYAHDIILKCYGIPLIIILLAGILCDATAQESSSVLVANAHVALGTQVSVYHTMQRIVKFGYHQLPSNNARNCLLHCLLFPEDQGIRVRKLIWHWIMDGPLQEAIIGFDEANRIGKEILDGLIKHGMVYLEDNDHVRMHDVIRETLSSLDNGYSEHSYRGNCLLEAISEEVLRTLDLSFTRIKVLPPSISRLTRLRMLLLSGCDHLEEIRHVGSLVQLEVLDASGCGSLKSIESGSFDRMTLLKVLDLSGTSITFLFSMLASMELRHLNLQGCPFVSDLPYGVSRSGIVQKLQLGSIVDPTDWMRMLWLPRGLTFRLSNRFGMKVSLDVNGDGNTYVFASDAYFFSCLEKDSPLWYSCFQKFQIVISPLMDDQTMDTDSQIRKTDSIFQYSCFRTMHFTHSTDFKRCLELNGTTGVPSDLEGILYHAELISLKRLTMVGQFLDLNIRCMKAVKELQIQNCELLESLLTPDEVQALSAVGSLHNLWISNIENLSSLCKGVKDVTSFSCIKHLLLDCCPNLACLFPSALRIPSLETLNIRFCDILERVFDTCVLGEDSLPRLQLLQLWELPEITFVCGGVLPSLKKLEVRGCAKLQKIPVGVNDNSPFVTTIGENLWWDNLIWEDESIKRWVLFRNWGPLLPHLATEG